MNDPQLTNDWLKTYRPELPFTSRVLLERVHTEAAHGDFSSALQDLSAVKESARSSDELIQAIILLKCALVECKMHLPSLAVEDLKQVIQILEPAGYGSTIHQHYRALAYWMLGNLSLPSTNPAQTVEATYGKSLNIFQFLAVHLVTPVANKTWYQERIREMQQAIQESVRKNDREWNLPKSALLPAQQKKLDILREIPAGGFGPDGAGSFLLGQLHLNRSMLRFQIQGKTHYLYNLRGSGYSVNLESDSKYCILKVRGESMRRAGIDPGDFILLRLQDFAENGDIVAAEIAGVDSQARLRSYLIASGKTILAVQSDCLEYSPQGQDGQIFYIRGVALGVFKTPDRSGSPKWMAEQKKIDEPAPGNRKEEDRKLSSSFLKLTSYPIYEEIPAGGPKVIPTPTGEQVELDRMWIHGEPYCIFNLVDSGRVINPRDAELIVLKVVGGSMNLANIADGDYILLRQQPVAEPGDIVAAEIHGVDDRATLKRYLIRLGKAVLAPESTDPKYEEMEFPVSGPDGDQGPYHIRGVALAVLKPCPNEPFAEKTPQEPNSAAL